MFALVYGSAIILASKTQCTRAPLTPFPPPLHIDGLITDETGLVIIGGGSQLEIDSVAIALIKSKFKYIELESRDINGIWPELSNGVLDTYVAASWAATGDSRCSRYAEFIADRPSPSRMALPWLKDVSKDVCLALESENTAKSQYKIKQ